MLARAVSALGLVALAAAGNRADRARPAPVAGQQLQAPEPPAGHATGHDALYSRRLDRWYYQHRVTRAVLWEKPEEPEKIFWWKYKGMVR